jgi:precorrin-6Y C5,15-methyltransferase (decarboxylating)
MKRIYVIGIGFRPLGKEAEGVLYGSGIILVNDSILEVFKRYKDYVIVKDRIRIVNNAHETIEYIRNNCAGQAVSVLAIGDPMFFGIGRIVVSEFGKDNVDIFPDLSSVQTAFSRIKEPWSGALLMSLHGGPDPENRRKTEYEAGDIPDLLKRYDKIAILTDEANDPSSIAREIMEIPSLKMYVCERLGCPDERITEGAPGDIAELFFSRPNVVIILR